MRFQLAIVLGHAAAGLALLAQKGVHRQNALVSREGTHLNEEGDRIGNQTAKEFNNVSKSFAPAGTSPLHGEGDRIGNQTAKALNNGSTALQKDVLYYHVHIPKTGGTTVSNMILADICEEGQTKIGYQEYASRCALPCRAALVDTELSCADPDRMEHLKWNVHWTRIAKLMRKTGAKKPVYITTLRSGNERVISQWAHELTLKSWSPPPSVPSFSNQSLLLYIRDGAHTGEGWFGRGSVSQRNNFQVSELAPVGGRQEVDEEHLALAKQRLKTGKWVIGFSSCLSDLHKRLLLLGRKGSSVSNPSSFATVPFTERRVPKNLNFNNDVIEELNRRCRMDNELFFWALEQSRHDQRFVRCSGATAFMDTRAARSFNVFED